MRGRVTSLTTLSQDVLQGAQRPRLASFPRGITSSGPDATEFSAKTGLVLDPWQAFCLDALFQERADGRWAARTGVVIVPRQNGKGAVDEAWELAQLFLNDCRIVLHTAHHAKTAKSAFMKMRAHIESSPLLKSRLMPDRSGGIRIANGEWGFTFKTGQQLIYGTRTSGAGRGLTIDATVLDEVQELSDDELDALKPTMVTAPNPQTLMTGSAPKDDAEVLPRLMARGRSGDSSLCYLEWSVDESLDADLDDRELWAVANPGYGIRLFDDAILDERDNMSDAGFARERLGIYAPTSSAGVFDLTVWRGLEDAKSSITGSVMLGVEVAEDRSWSAIGASGVNDAGKRHLEVVDYKRDVRWVVDRVTELARKHSAAVVVRPSSPAGSLIPDLETAGVTVHTASTQQYAQACGALFDGVKGLEVTHLGQGELDASVRGAKKKPAADAFIWDIRKSGLDISPLVAVTLADWGVKAHGESSADVYFFD